MAHAFIVNSMDDISEHKIFIYSLIFYPFYLRQGEVPKGDWLNYTIKVMVTWYDQVIIEMFVQQII